MTTFISKITEIGPRIIRILGCNPGPMTLQGTNTYLIGTGRKRVLLDVGEAKNAEYITSLETVLQQQDTTIDQIVISHWHHDHIGGLSDVLKCLHEPVSVYKIPRLDKEDEPMPHLISYIPLKHQDEIKTQGATLRVHHTPGHTTDHAVLELVEEDAVFSGDCVLGEGTTVFEDLHSYMTSLQMLVKMCPKIVYPGHGPIIEDPLPKIQHYIDHRNQREKQILKVMNLETKKFFTAMEVVKAVYKDTPQHLHPAAAENVTNHMHKLLKDGKVVSQGDRWCLVHRNGKL
uniref:Beta-lactamase-like protein 2 homolog n=1 Tax=Scylla olivacea TaxID=85551 RepID=A0A0P4WLA5_SCYOL